MDTIQIKKNKQADEEIMQQKKDNTRESMKLTKKKSYKTLAIVIGVLIVVALVAGFAYKKYTSSTSYIEKKAKKEAAEVVKSAGKLILLPAGEPSIFVIQDPALLVSQQAFFQGSVAGDQLLVYPEAAKAIIYSPSRDIVVNMGPVTGNTNQKVQEKTIEKTNASTTDQVKKTETKKATSTKKI